MSVTMGSVALPSFTPIFVLGLVMLGGCIDHPEAPTVPGGSSTPPPATGGQQGTTQPGTPIRTADPKAVLTEAVYVFMDDYNGESWICTGALIAKDMVVTAAHCLDEGKYQSFSVIAPLAADKSRVWASSVASFSGEYETISNPDIGLMRLHQPIEVPSYATLTDVSARVEKGEKLTAVALVRQAEEAEAPLKAVSDLILSSAVASGYEHGFSTPLFSHGGDSGAGLFLVENGQPTHKLIGVARQPEPPNRDHFTRIDAEIKGWFDGNAE